MTLQLCHYQYICMLKDQYTACNSGQKKRKFGQYGLGGREVLGSEVKLQLISETLNSRGYMRGTTRLIRRHVHLAVCLPTVCGVFSSGSLSRLQMPHFPRANSFAGFTRSSLHRAQANTKRSLNTLQSKKKEKKIQMQKKKMEIVHRNFCSSKRLRFFWN